MMADLPRRGFLRQLAALPLIGGGVTLIGQPSAVAEPVTLGLLQSYKTWLHFEYRSLSWEMANHPQMVAYYGGSREQRYDAIEGLVNLIDAPGATRFHRYDGTSLASDRAAIVLSAVGCDWRNEEACT